MVQKAASSARVQSLLPLSPAVKRPSVLQIYSIMSSCRLFLLSAVVLLLSTAIITEGMRYNSVKTTCCYSFTSKPLRAEMVTSYNLTSLQCLNQAVLFTTKRGKQVCAKPNMPWAKKLMKFLDNPKKGGQGPI